VRRGTTSRELRAWNHRRPRLAVMIPCFNEGSTIAKVVFDFRRALPGSTIYVFDNNSTDDSIRQATEAGATVIKEKHQGKGFVVKSMLTKVMADIYVMVDGDDTYPADRVMDLMRPVLDEEADMVVGQRNSDSPSRAYRRFHVAGNRLVCGLINMIWSANLRDPLSGYRVFTREVASELPVVAFGFDVETEMTIQLLYRRYIIKEVPIAYRERPSGSASKLSTFKDGFLVLSKVFAIARAYKPLTFFGGIGILLVMLGVLAGLYGLWRFGEDQLSSLLGCLALALTGVFGGLVSAAVGIVIHTLNFRLLELSSTMSKLGRDDSDGGRT
jgi:glycosyltransferase involved in cell wall biosynthesis